MAMTPEDIEIVSSWKQGSPRITKLDASLTHLIRDDRPFLPIRHVRSGKLSVRHQSEQMAKMSKEELAKYGLEGNWYKLFPMPPKQISQERSFGHVTIELNQGLDISCYLIPAKLLSVEQVIWMVRDIEAEMDAVPLWALEGSSPLRPYVKHTNLVDNRPFYTELIDESTSEYKGAIHLSGQSREEIGPRMIRMLPTPEEGLRAAWAKRRSHQLKHCIRDLNSDLRDIDSRLSDPRRNHDRESLMQAHNECTNSLKRAQILVRRLNTLISHSPCFSLQLTPEMQRDYRLRRLLRAFQPRTHEVWQFTHGERSTLPPTRLPDIFEVWVAVMLVQWLTRMGFSKKRMARKSIRSRGTLISAEWELQLQNVTAKVQYEPDPPCVDHVPPLNERSTSALQWAGAAPDLGSQLYSVDQSSAPDFIIQVSGPNGSAMAIGDATLADPDHTNPRSSKMQKLSHYRSTIGWSTPPTVTTCHLKGAFVVYPGTEKDWHLLADAAARQDCQLICAHPTEKDKDVPQRFSEMVSALISAVS